MSVAIIQKLFLNHYGEVKRVRELPESFDGRKDITVDVGGKYDVKENIFDHHFKGGDSDGSASIGKVWREFGEQICRSKIIADRVYDILLGSMDRIDISLVDWRPSLEAEEKDWRHVSASLFISTMNAPFESHDIEKDRAFKIAVEACKVALEGAIENARSWASMKEVVDVATCPTEKVLFLKKGGPWQEHVCPRPEFDEILYVLYPSDRGGYIVQCVPPEAGSFGKKKEFPEEIAGIRENELSSKLNELTGQKFTPDSSLFCHPGRFIAGAANLEEAI